MQPPTIIELKGRRTLLPLPFPVFADAAFARGCGVVFTVKQHVSPNRPLKVSPRGQVKSSLSPQRGSTIEERDFSNLRCKFANVPFSELFNKWQISSLSSCRHKYASTDQEPATCVSEPPPRLCTLERFVSLCGQ